MSTYPFGDKRGSAVQRRVRRVWLLAVFSTDLGPNHARCEFGCGTIVDIETMSIDRYPTPGARGGRYTRNNIRPACLSCNSKDGSVVRKSIKEERWSLQS